MYKAGVICFTIRLGGMIRVLKRAFYLFRGVATEAAAAFRADDVGESFRLNRWESVNNDIFDPVSIVTRTAAIPVPIARTCEWYIGLWFQRILVHLVIPQTIRTLYENMEMGVIMSGTSCGLEDDNVSDIEFTAAAGIENIFETGISCSHQLAKQPRVTKKPDPQKLRHGQDHMAISHAGKESSGNEVCPSVGIDLGTGKTKAGLAGESDTTYLSAVAASVLDKAHFLRITAVEHFLDSFVVVRAIEAWTELLKRIPVIVENLLECIFINAFHGRPLRTTITELAK